MIKIELSGRTGQMGQVLEKMINDIPDMEVVTDGADVIIDFSHYSKTKDIINKSVDLKIPLVIATTGLGEDDQRSIDLGAKEIAILNSSNMSLGINILAKVLEEIAPVLENDFDIEIIEKHHNQKKDAPSGTSILLGDSINDSLKNKKEFINGREGKDIKCSREEIGFHAVRGGTIPGEHTVIFAGLDEVIEIKHTAYSKNIFAKGAIDAARFLLDQKPGRYEMADVINSANKG